MADTADWTATVFGVAATDTADLADWTWAVYGAGGTFAAGGGGGGTAQPPVVGYAARWDATAITATADGAPLAVWPDLSANRYDLTQTNPAYRPTFYNTNPTYLINGQPAVWFGGGPIMVTATGPTLPQPVTVIAVAYDTVLSNDYLWSSNGATSLPAVYRSLVPSWAIAAGGSQFSSYLASRSSANFVAAVINGASSIVQTDGDIYAPAGSVGSTPLAGAMNVGANSSGTQPFNGAVGEIIVYPSALSAADRNSLRAYAQAKWGTP